MSNLIRHPYHLVDESPWPIIRGGGALILTLGFAKWFHTNSVSLFFIAFIIICIIIIQWWRDISREAAFQGLHTPIVEFGLRWGIVLFIVSEVFFFLSFFWAFFHSSLCPVIELGRQWPPSGIAPFNAFQVPFLNTLVLLRSGVSVTWSHHSLISGNLTLATQALTITILLGIYFTLLQAIEYLEASFSIADRAFGATFFVATGFHGIHVLVGTSFLLVCLARIHNIEFRAKHHFGFEAAAWYWHFVDVVWLFLFTVIYWWGRA